MPSLQSKIIKAVLRLQGRKRKIRRARQLIESGKTKRVDQLPSQKLYEKHRVSTREVKERIVWTVAPKENAREKLILYLHGGGYVNGFSKYHWRFISNLVGELGCTVVAPDYPLAPEHQAADVFEMMFPLYEELVAAAGASNLIVMGDSAGGGLGLALLMRARERGVAQPSELILLSPWLDVTMTNADAEKIDRFDPFLDAEGLRYLGKIYAGETPATSYLVSPIYGSLEKLAPITLFIGTHDIFAADCRKLKLQAEAQDVRIDYHEYEEMVHVWMLIPSPEERKAAKAIIDKIGGHS